jgi:hypothetical protein
MRAKIAATLFLATVMGTAGYPAESSAPLTGCWELRASKGTAGGKDYSLPGNLSGSQMKCYSRGHFAFVGQFTLDGAAHPNYGGGSYSLKGDEYAETLLYHVAASSVGQTLRFELVVKGNEMTLTGPLDAHGLKSLGNTLTEVYSRKD